jgi:Protein of unknown function (DUF732)
MHSQPPGRRGRDNEPPGPDGPYEQQPPRDPYQQQQWQPQSGPPHQPPPNGPQNQPPWEPSYGTHQQPRPNGPYQEPPPGGPYQQSPYQPQPPRKRRLGLKITLGIVGGVILLIIVAAALGSSPKTTDTAASQASSGSAPAQGTSSPAATLTARQTKFVSVIRANLTAKGFSNTSTDAQFAAVGEQICSARQGGSSQTAVVSASTAAPDKFAMSPKKFVRTAEKYLCPQYLPKPPVVILRLSGNGIQNSGPVLVTQSTLQVHYSYDCSSAGGDGNFIADFETANQASLDSDDQTIANALGSGGSASTTIYPQNTGSEYHLAINSECDWSVTVSAPSS